MGRLRDCFKWLLRRGGDDSSRYAEVFHIAPGDWITFEGSQHAGLEVSFYPEFDPDFFVDVITSRPAYDEEDEPCMTDEMSQHRVVRFKLRARKAGHTVIRVVHVERLQTVRETLYDVHIDAGQVSDVLEWTVRVPMVLS